METATATGASALQGRCLRTFRPFLHSRHQFLEFLSLLVCHGMRSGISALRVSLLVACSFVALLLISFLLEDQSSGNEAVIHHSTM